MNGINKSPLWHGSGFWVVISRCILEIQPHVCCCDFLLLAFVPFMPLSVESRLSFVQKHSVFGVCLFFFTLCQFVCFPPSVLCLSCILCALVLFCSTCFLCVSVCVPSASLDSTIFHCCMKQFSDLPQPASSFYAVCQCVLYILTLSFSCNIG